MPHTRSLLAVLCLALAVSVMPHAAGAQEARIVDNIVIHSFDQTPIVATLMLPAGASAEDPVPVVLETHGWGGERRREPSGTVGQLLQRGYAVLTWDSRGFGESGGEANIGAPEFEVRDAQALIDYLAGRPEILLDAPGDPRVGWIGGSNAAGVQFNTAAVDDRIDAIVPAISWGNLTEDLLPNGVPKQTWNEALYGTGLATATTLGLISPSGTQTGAYAREIHIGHAQIATTQQLSSDIQAWFSERSTTLRSGGITAPTLIIQGSIDTLFPLQGAFDNYANLVAAGTPVKLMTYCSGHTLVGCRYPGGDSGYPDGAPAGALPVWEERTLAWLDRWVMGERSAAIGPRVEWQAQDGHYYGAKSYPLPGTVAVAGLPMTTDLLVGPGGTGGDGPAHADPAPAAELGLTAARATVLEPAGERRPLLGVPRVTLRGTVTGLTAFAFLELVDVAPDGTRVTVDDQAMPVRLGNGAVETTTDLHGVSWIVEPGHALELEITTGSAQYAVPRTGPYTIDLTAETVLPLAPARQAR